MVALRPEREPGDAILQSMRRFVQLLDGRV
jgi:hypothetical protein